MNKSILERIAALEQQVGKVDTLELRVAGLEPMREAIEWLGATIQGQTEALNIVVEELGTEFGQKVTANHARRQEARRQAEEAERQAAIQASKDAVQKLIEGGILVPAEKAGPRTMMIGLVTKDDKVVQPYEAGIFENFPPELQAALQDQPVESGWDGPKGRFVLKEVYQFRKPTAAQKVDGLADTVEQQQPAAPEAPAAETNGNQE